MCAYVSVCAGEHVCVYMRVFACLCVYVWMGVLQTEVSICTEFSGRMYNWFGNCLKCGIGIPE